MLEVAELAQPDRVVFTDGSDEEWTRLTDELVAAGTFTRLTAKKNSFYAASDPTDVARVEDRTFICSVDQADAGATNNWMDPAAMKAIMTGLYSGSMRGRTMYVVPFCMGPYDAANPKLGVEITDSEYVVASMRIMTRMGTKALELINAGCRGSRRCTRSARRWRPASRTCAWPCNDTKYIVQFPEERMIWSFGSGYGGNALLGKKCYSLRIASVMARDEGWLAEHMLILKITSPRAEGPLHRRRLPQRLRQDQPGHAGADHPGLEGRDARRRHRLDDLRRGRPAVRGQPRVRPVRRRAGHRLEHQPQRHAHHRQGQLGVHQRRAHRRRRHLVGGHDRRAAGPPDRLEGPRLDPDGLDADGNELASAGEPSSHPNSRFCTPITQCPIIADEYFAEPHGVPISAILFGGRRKTTIPLVTQSRDWQHGVFMGATLSTETTAAATGAVGVVRRDPMAMLPFIGYNAGDYFAHWIDVGKGADASKLPKIFYVNWFRRDADGGFLWPGFGENSRVLKWVVERLEGDGRRGRDPDRSVPDAGVAGRRRPGHDRRAGRPPRWPSIRRNGRPRSR